MLSTTFPFTLSRSHFKSSVKGGKKNIPGEIFIPVFPKKIKQRDQTLQCEKLENSDCAPLKIDAIKVTDTDNFF